jgi:hypothetical protein
MISYISNTPAAEPSAITSPRGSRSVVVLQVEIADFALPDVKGRPPVAAAEMLHPFAQAELGMPDGSRAGCRTAWMMISVSVAS